MTTDRTPAAVERQIDCTRSELALTLDALERKLTAQHLMEKGLDMFRDTLGGPEGLNRGLELIRANPIPVALIGFGTAWLVASNTQMIDRLAQNERVEAARRRVADLASDIGNRAGEIASDVADRVGLSGQGSDQRPLGHTGNPMVDQGAGQNRSDGWMHQMTDMAQGALRSARDSGGAMLNRAGGYAGDGASRVADQLNDTFQRHPMVLGAVGIMAGALLAALLPMSRTENEWFGGTRDELFQRAQEAGEEAVTRVRETAARAVEAASDTVSRELDKPPQV